MDKILILNRLKNLYDTKENIIDYLKRADKRDYNIVEDIMISYDFQAGSYVKQYKADSEAKKFFLERFVQYIIGNEIRGKILEAGVGEGTTLIPLLQKVKQNFEQVYGFDISWSRVKIAKKFEKENQMQNINFFLGDLFCIPLKNDSIELVYTCHSIEPNGGKEKEILMELYRVTKNYLVLLEPTYEFAGDEARKRMEKYGYITNLYETAIDLGYNVIEYSLYGTNSNDLNPTGMLVIKKDDSSDGLIGEPLCCPITKANIQKFDDAYYSEESLLTYPIIRGIPCLTRENAVVATKFLE